MFFGVGLNWLFTFGCLRSFDVYSKIACLSVFELFVFLWVWAGPSFCVSAGLTLVFAEKVFVLAKRGQTVW